MIEIKTKISLVIFSFLLLSIGLTQVVHAAPPAIVLCTENSTMTQNTQLCKGGTWVTCDNSQNGQKSTDGLLVCTASKGKWEDVVVDNPPPPPATCANGDTKSNDSQICQSNAWVTCTAGKEGTTISDKKCTSLKWVTPSNPQSPTAKITKVTVFPLGFNPSIDSTKISYTTSLKAIIDIKITNNQGQVMGTLVDNQTLNAGSYFVNWYGTKDNKQGGTVLNSGTYTYKIVAKNTKTNAVEDSKEGTITLIFAGQEPPVEPPKPDGPTPEELAAQAAATLALQNAKKGTTTKVGPGILIYSVLPFVGYVISRRRK